MFASFSIGTMDPKVLDSVDCPMKELPDSPCTQIDQLDKLVGYRMDKWFGVLRTL